MLCGMWADLFCGRSQSLGVATFCSMCQRKRLRTLSLTSGRSVNLVTSVTLAPAQISETSICLENINGWPYSASTKYLLIDF
jgi:hypothetical protein